MRLLDDWLKHYIDYNHFNEAPEHFHFWTGVGVIAAALRRKTWINMGYFQWTPNFYILFIAPPGIVTKSTTIHIGQDFLREISGVHFGPDSLTWQSLIAELTEVSEAVPFDNGDYHQMSCLTFFVSELGTFINFEDTDFLDLLVDLWDGRIGNFARRTMGAGKSEAINPWLNILGCTTPAWLSDNLPRALIDGGFSSRCIWLFGYKKKRRIAYPQRLIVPAQLETLKLKLVHDLQEISQLKGEFRLTEEAYQFGESWYEKHCDKLEEGDPQRTGISGYFARTQTHIHKLAMVLSAARREDLQITKKELEDAAMILGTVESDIPKVFKSLSTSVEMEKASDILNVVRSRGKIRRTELYQMFFHKMSSKEFAESISSAVEAGYLVQVQSGVTLWIAVPGREST
jgi:hypothetical protein